MDFRPHIEKFRRRFAEIEAVLSDPKVFDHAQRAQELSKEYARLKELVAAGDGFLKAQADLAENRALLQNELPDSELAVMAKTIPAGTVGTVDDVVGAVLYLLSDEASYVNGANLHVSGGWGI